MANYMALEQKLKSLVNKRLSAAAAEELLGIVGRIITEFEDQALHSKQEIDRQRRLLDMVLKPDIKLHRADFSSSSLVQEEPEPLQIKEEQEELLGPEDADGSTLTLLSVRSEDYAENRGTEAGALSEPLDITPMKHLKTPPHVEDCGVSPPSSSGLSLSSHFSGSDTEENMEDKSDGNTLNKTHAERRLYASYKQPLESNLLCCRVCGKVLDDYINLVTHMRIHTGGKNSTCGKSFNCNETLKSHMRSHKGGKKGEKGYLTQHASTHTSTGEKSFECSDCGKFFGQIDYLKKHMRIHTGVKSYSCAVCDKCFRNNTHLKTHMRTHTGEKPFSCSNCGKGFSQTSSLKTHMRIHSEKVIT